MKTISCSVGRRDSSGNLSQFHYARPDRPYLVTQVFHPRESSITNLVYDHQDRLVLVKINQVPAALQYYIIITYNAGFSILYTVALHFRIY